MTDHDHKQVVPGCYRCDLGNDEERESMLNELDELRAFLADLREAMELLAQVDDGQVPHDAWLNARDALLAKHKEATDG